MTAYFLVSNRKKTEGSTDAQYCGIDRTPWECVDEIVHSNPAIAALRRASLIHFAGNLSFGTFDSLREVQFLATECACPTHDTKILAVTPVGTIDQALDELGLSSGLGFDIYVDGYGSPIALGMERICKERPELEIRVNKAGLLASLTEVRSFWLKYIGLTEHLDLEPLSDVGQAWIYQVVEEIEL